MIKKTIGTLVLLVLSYLLQTTLFNRIGIAGVKPNILVIFIACVGYRYGKIPGMLTGFLTGLLMDCVEGSYIGMYALFYTVIGYVNGFANRVYFHDFTITPMALTGISDFLLNLMIYISGFLLRNRLNLPYYVVKIFLPEMIYTIVLSVFLYRFYNFCYRLLDTHRAPDNDPVIEP